MILVTGATGNVGGQVIEQLSSTGAPVRAFVHDPEKGANVRKTGVEIAEGFLRNRRRWTRRLRVWTNCSC